MTKPAMFPLKLEPELEADFLAEVEAAQQQPSEVIHELMRAFVQQQRDRRDHSAFLREKVARARKSIEAGRGRSAEEVDADFAARRSGLVGRA